MQPLLSNALFGITLSLLAFYLGVWLDKKARSPITNPLFLGIIITIAILSIFRIPYQSYKVGGDILTTFLAPATALLSVNIYNQLKVLKQNLWPVLLGCAGGTLVSMGWVYLLGRLFALDEQVLISLLPKSVTTPFAMELASLGGGIPGLAVSAVIITGLTGALVSPLLIKIFRIKSPVVIGVAIGTSSHAIGTAKAMEMGEVEGAMSSISIGISGLATVVWMLLFVL